jgi:hypothetical protein
MYCPRSSLFVSSAAVVIKPVYVLVLGISIPIIIYAEENEGIDYIGQPKYRIEEIHKWFPSDSRAAFSANNLTVPVGQLMSQERDTCSFIYLSDAS